MRIQAKKHREKRRQLLTNVKDKDRPVNMQGTVYDIKCCKCQAIYIETGEKRATG